MNRSDFRCLYRLRVRWAEIDAQQIVFNGHYLMYLDTAMAAYWRAVAVPYAESMLQLAGDLYVRKATLEYEGPAHYDDVLDVGLRCARIGSSSIRFDGAVFRGAQRLVRAELVYVFADPQQKASRPVPERLRALLEGYERGEPVLDVQVGDWATLGAEAQALRRAVFVVEQGIPAELEWDANDASAVHAVARNRLGLVVGTGRMLEAAPGVSKIGRMAVHRGLRSGGIGAAVLQALVDAARSAGQREVVLHAQASAIAFYERHGFAPQGPRFEEAGIVHQAMAIAL